MKISSCTMTNVQTIPLPSPAPSYSPSFHLVDIYSTSPPFHTLLPLPLLCHPPSPSIHFSSIPFPILDPPLRISLSPTPFRSYTPIFISFFVPAHFPPIPTTGLSLHFQSISSISTSSNSSRHSMGSMKTRNVAVMKLKK